MAYRDFTLRIVAADSGYRAELLDSPAGERAECTFDLPFAPGELAELARRHGRAVRASRPLDLRHVRPAEGSPRPAPPDLDEVGRRLSAALFQGRVRERFLESQARHPRLRVKLRFDLTEEGAAHLHGVPWELIGSPVDGRPPLALSRETPLVRYLEVAGSVDLPPPPETLEVRLVAAQPAGTERLDLDGEARSLRAALEDRTTITLRRIRSPTLAGIVEALREPGVHVLHVMGHGDGDPATGDGVLVLEDGSGRIDAVTAGRLVEQAGSYLRRLRLVFLNACRTAETSERAPLAGLAAALMEAGVPAVIAMRGPITDAAAARFAARVYGRIAAGAPIDEAVTEGRLALRDAERRTRSALAEWATPALFLRVPDGRLFVPAEAAAPGPKAATPRRRGRSWAAALAAAGVLSAGVAGVLVWSARSGDGRGSTKATKVPADFQTTETEGARKVPDGVRKVPAELQDGDGAGADEAGSRKVPADFQGESSGAEKGLATGLVRELADGASAEFPEAAAVVTVDFLELQGEPFVRISLLPDGGPVQTAPAFGPDTLDFHWGDAGLSVHVLHVDWTTRTARLRVFR